MSDEYAGCMSDHLFLTLSPEKEKQFRQWTRDNWTVDKPEDFNTFHPVVRDEWRQIDEVWRQT